MPAQTQPALLGGSHLRDRQLPRMVCMVCIHEVGVHYGQVTCQLTDTVQRDIGEHCMFPLRTSSTRKQRVW
jgi:predicted Zn-dependent protease with MMP-like domain